MADFGVELTEHHGRVRKVWVLGHPVTKQPRRHVGYCGMTWEHGWSLIHGHELRAPHIAALEQKLREAIEGGDSQQSGDPAIG